ncbi:MAG: ATP-binding protein [Treponemataceae bacterium]|nr:ATP-binding protein [Treponemataceae bacterium]
MNIVPEKKSSVLDAIISIYEKLEASKLSPDAIDSVSSDFKIVQDYLGCNQTQASFFSIIFALQNKTGEGITLQMIADYLGENYLYLIKYKKEINVLIRENLVECCDEGRSRSETFSYTINNTVSDCIVEDFPLEKENNCKATQEILCEINDLIIKWVRRNSTSLEYLKNLSELEARYENNEVIKNVLALYPEEVEARIFIYTLCYRLVNSTDCQNDDESDDEPASFNYKIFPTKTMYSMKNKINDGSFSPLKEGYAGKKISIPSSSFSRRIRGVAFTFRLTRKGIDTFFGKESQQYEAEEVATTEFDNLKQFLVEFSLAYENHNASNTLKKRDMRKIETQYASLSFVKKVQKVIPDKDDRFIFYDCCKDFVVYSASSSLIRTLEDMYGQGTNYFKKAHEFKDEKNFLLKEGFLILEKNENISKTTMSPSDRTITLIYGKNADLFVKSDGAKYLIEPEKLKSKELFYPESIISQIEMLKNSLEHKNLIAMQKRLEQKGLPKGIAVLLYGAAGTGKTESVYQIAKATNRKIYHVDISETKSMWFGESEKLIKRVFVDYKNLCTACQRRHENTPILLFNEADAIISKRKSVEAGNVAQTENAIQNIILEQMENLDGIMIATTNLCENMDKAFERRFLFKIKFEKPGLKERCLIWKSKLPLMSEDDVETVARKYDFSGGEIDNIVRKCEIDEIITGNTPDFPEIMELCKNERLEKEEEKTMGFCLT